MIEHGRRRVGDALEHAVDVEDRLALSDDAEARARLLARLFARGVARRQLSRAQRLAHDDPHLLCRRAW
jgi:hypothetical protein